MKTRRNMCVFVLCLALLILGWATAMSAQVASGNADSSANAAQSTGQQTISGEWQGALARQHLIVKIEQPTDSSLKGTLGLPDQGNISLPMDAVSLEQGTVRFELKRIGVSYDGKLSSDGSEINGTWHQGGATLPLLFHRPGAAAKFTLSPRTQGRIALTPCRNRDGNV